MGDIDIAVVDSLKVLDPKRPIREADMANFCERVGKHRRGGRNCGYSPDSIVRSSRKRISSSLLVSEITKRTRPWPEVSA